MSRLHSLRASVLLAGLGLLLAVGLGVAAVAWAATKHGVTPIAPTEGERLPARQSPTFVLRARGGGEVSVRVCRSRTRRRSDGLICGTESVGVARRFANGIYRYRPTFHDYPGFWLNRPGVYYWQAHRIRCERRRTKDCRQEGPVVAFRIDPP